MCHSPLEPKVQSYAEQYNRHGEDLCPCYQPFHHQALEEVLRSFCVVDAWKWHVWNRFSKGFAQRFPAILDLHNMQLPLWHHALQIFHMIIICPSHTRRVPFLIVQLPIPTLAHRLSIRRPMTQRRQRPEYQSQEPHVRVSDHGLHASPPIVSISHGTDHRGVWIQFHKLLHEVDGG